MNDTTTTAPDLATASDDDLKAMGLPARFTLESLSGSLTEEEIDALSEGDDPLLSKPAAADDDDDDDDDDAGDNAAGAGGDTPPPAEAKPDPVFTPVDVTAHQAVLDGLKDERKKLRDAWNDGDLTDEEFDQKTDELNDKAIEARTAIKEAGQRQEDYKAELANTWYAKTDRVLAANPALKDNQPVAELDGNSVLALFDAACRQVTSHPNFAHMTLDQKLAQAERMTSDVYKARTGKDLAAPKRAAKADPAEKIDPKAKVREQGKRPDPVQTLGTITAASEIAVEDSRFAGIDKLDGLEQERAFAAMSPAERDAYLAGQ